MRRRRGRKLTTARHGEPIRRLSGYMEAVESTCTVSVLSESVMNEDSDVELAWPCACSSLALLSLCRLPADARLLYDGQLAALQPATHLDTTLHAPPNPRELRRPPADLAQIFAHPVLARLAHRSRGIQYGLELLYRMTRTD